MSASSSQPGFSVVVVTPERFRNIRQTVRHLRAQTVREQIELLIVAPTQEAVSDHEPHELAGFHSVRILPDGPIDNVDAAASVGILAARATAVASIEDHAFPDALWAEAHMQAHAEGDWAVVGSLMKNANPDNPLSWTNLLIAYGFSMEPAQGEQATIAGHNVSYNAAVVQAYGERLPTMLTRGGGLIEDLKANGHRFYLASEARIYHVNPSSLASTADLRFSAGRLYGANRAKEEGWNGMKRALYTAGGPLIPLVRFKRLREELFGHGTRQHLVPKVFPALLLGLVFDGLGQMAGYALGPGEVEKKLSNFEMDRYQHLDTKDQDTFADVLR
ncbi:MAG: hypothetical protein AAGI71_11800 [Bacteroidota bacterium]